MPQFADDLCSIRGELVSSNVYRASPDGRYLAIARCPSSGSYVERFDTLTHERTRVGEICTRGCFASGNIRTWSGGFFYVDSEPTGTVITMLDWELTNRRRVELERSAALVGSDSIYLAETSPELVFARSSGSQYTWRTPMPADGATVTARASHDNAAASLDPDLSLEAYVAAGAGYQDTLTVNGHALHVTRFSPSSSNGWAATVTDPDGTVRTLPTDALPSYMTYAADEHARVRIALSRNGQATYVTFWPSIEPRVRTTEIWRLDATGPSLVATIPWSDRIYHLTTHIQPTESGVFSVFYAGDQGSNGVHEQAIMFLE